MPGTGFKRNDVQLAQTDVESPLVNPTFFLSSHPLGGIEWVLLFIGIGCAVGLLYFGGLWLTVWRLPDARRPHLWLVLSGLGRLVGLGGAFWGVVAWGGPLAVLLALAGVIGMRTILLRLVSADLTR